MNDKLWRLLYCEIIHWSNGVHTDSSPALQPARVVLLQTSIEHTGVNFPVGAA
jgi:hypothetical protein